MATAGGGAGNGVPSAYGFGWFLQQGPGGRTARHTGDWPGYTADVIHGLDRDYTIVVLSNTEDPAAVGLANAIEGILTHRPYTLPPMSIAREVGRVVVDKGLAAGVDRYRTLRRTRAADFDFGDEGELNALGYEFLRRGMTHQAVGVLRLNAETFPTSWNAFDSLGEAYAASGDTADAVRSYRRSVQLNPRNANGAQALARLGGP